MENSKKPMNSESSSEDQLSSEDELVQSDTQKAPNIGQNDTPRDDVSALSSEDSDIEDLIGRVKEHSPQCMQDWQAEFVPEGATPQHAVPERLGRFKILEVVGHGGYGIVYKALDEELNRFVALKVPRLETLMHESQRQRMLQEAKAMCRLSHPNLATIYEAGHIGQVYYIASELYTGGTLADVFSTEERLTHRVSAELILSLASAVQHAHSRGILHRDIKPTNVLFEAIEISEGDLAQQARLIDFGLAKQLDSESGHTQTGALLGTPEYMSPEQAESRKEEIGTASDVYSLGAILYHALVGRPPHQGDSLLSTLAAVRDEQVVALSQLDATISRDLEAICLKCLEKDSAKRYPTAQALREDLESWLAGESVQARLPTFPERMQRWCVRNPAWAMLSATVFLALTTTTLVIGIAYSQVQAANTSLQESNASLERSRASEAERSRQLLRSLDAQVSVVLEDMLARSFELNDAHREYFANTLEAYEAFTTIQEDDPSASAAAARAYVRIGEIRNRLGDSEAAIEAFSLADQRFVELEEAGTASPELQMDHSKALGKLSTTLKDQQSLDAARDTALKAMQISNKLTEEYPTDLKYRRVSTEQLSLLAYIENAAGNPPKGIELFRNAVETGGKELGDSAEDRYLLAKLKSSLAQLLFAKREFQEIEQLLSEADSSVKELLIEAPTKLGYSDLRSSILNMLGFVYLSTGRMKEAQSTLQSFTDLRREMANRYPAQTEYQSDFVMALNNFGSVMKQSGKPEDANSLWEEGYQAAKRLVSIGSEDPFVHSQLAALSFHLAQNQLEKQGNAPAKLLAEEGKQALEFALTSNPKNPMFQQVLGEQYLVLSQVYSAEELHDQAFEQAILWSGTRGSPPGTSLTIARIQAKAAIAAQESGDNEQAEVRKLATQKTLQSGDPAILVRWKEVEEDADFVVLFGKDGLASLRPSPPENKPNAK